MLEQKITHNPKNDINLSWINPGLQPLNINQVRQLIADLQFFAPNGKIRYVIVLKIDQASEEAQNALLKTLEEEGENLQFIITACDESQVLPTVISRCIVKIVQLPHQGNSDNHLPKPIDTGIKINSYAQAIKMAEEFTDRTSAYDQLQNWLYSLVKKGTAKNLTQTKIIRQTLVNLKQNGNMRLILENCFFQLKIATSKWSKL